MRTLKKLNSLVQKPEIKELRFEEEYCPDCIFGYNFFQFSPSTFAPVDNCSCESFYITFLVQETKSEINFYGSKERKVKSYCISREGKVVLPLLGPVNFLGKTYAEAQKAIQEKQQQI